MERILKVQLLLCIVIVASNNDEIKQERDGAHATVIATFLEKFIKPFLRATHIAPIKINTQVTPPKEPDIAHTIRKKITQLKPLLDDNMSLETDNDLTLQGNEETTVIEFLPETIRRFHNSSSPLMTHVNPLKSSINKYKLLRQNIKTALDEELISKATKVYIMNTLDDMIAQMIESQCIWNNHPLRKQFKGNDTSDSLQRVQGMSKKQWTKLRQKYMQYLTQRKQKENLFINQFHQFFSKVINETSNLSDRYKIKCHLVKTKENQNKPPNTPVLRELKEHKTRGQLENKGKCLNFKLCSDELRDFFNDFYMDLNDTVVSTFSNYAAMYVRDFGVDLKVVDSIINKLGVRSEQTISKIYKNEINNFELTSNKDKNENIRLITLFIKATISEVKALIKENMVEELGFKKTKLFLTIKEDLFVNLEVDLDNLENYYIDSFCAKFLMCNGRFPSRRQDDWTFHPKVNNEIYVKVQLSLDDQTKDAVVKSGLLQIIEHPDNVKLKFKNKNALHTITRTTLNTNDETTTENKHKRHGKSHKPASHSTMKEAHMTRSMQDSVEKDNEIIQT